MPTLFTSHPDGKKFHFQIGCFAQGFFGGNGKSKLHGFRYDLPHFSDANPDRVDSV
jgi:hypothetical protein